MIDLKNSRELIAEHQRYENDFLKDIFSSSLFFASYFVEKTVNFFPIGKASKKDNLTSDCCVIFFLI